MKRVLCIVLAVLMVLSLAACGNKNKDNELEGLRWKSTAYGDIERFEDGIMYYEDYGLQFEYKIADTEETDEGKIYYIDVTDPEMEMEEAERIVVTVNKTEMTLATEATQDHFELVK